MYAIRSYYVEKESYIVVIQDSELNQELSEIPLAVYLIEWVPSILVAIFLMRKSVAATIDGEPVGAMRKPVVAPAAD